jgi:uncharacterized membrane protein YfcA
MVYVVGVPDAHVAIGTSAIAVATNAAVNLSNHARGGTVVWSCALAFAAAGILGAFCGSLLGKMLDGQRLLALFAVIMLVIAALMLKTRARIGVPDVKMNLSNLPAILGLGLATGTLSGFFGIGGGFLIVPALMLATGMSIINAVSSSLVAVTAFGLTTAASYAWSGWRGICRSGAGRSIPCLLPSLSRWRSICWRVTYPYLEPYRLGPNRDERCANDRFDGVTTQPAAGAGVRCRRRGAWRFAELGIRPKRG